MTFGSGVVLRAIVFAAAVGLTWIGVGFLAYGAFLVLIPSTGVAGAAFAIAMISIAIGSLVLVFMFMRTPHVQVEHRVAAAETQVVEGGAMIKALSEMAVEHPLMAVCCAAILGATNGADGVKRR